MGKQYGVELSVNTLIFLSSERSFEDRILKGISEIATLKEEDLKKDHFQKIQEIKRLHSKVNEGLSEVENRRKNLELMNDLVYLCVDIISDKNV